MNHIILASHSKLAAGMKETVLFLKTDCEIDVVEQLENETDFEKKLVDLLVKNKDKKCVVFTDLYGGSVNQTAFKNLKDHSFYLVTGMNLALILEAVFAEDDIDDEFIKDSIRTARDQICFMNDLLNRQED